MKSKNGEQHELHYVSGETMHFASSSCFCHPEPSVDLANKVVTWIHRRPS